MARYHLLKASKYVLHISSSKFSTSSTIRKSYQLVVVGGGTGGCATASKFTSKLGKGKVAVIEPSDMHYYQPMWTLVGGGMKSLEESGKPMGAVLPKDVDWIKQKVVSFMPNENKVVTDDGQEIGYEFLVVAMGLQLNYSEIKGLPEAFESPGIGSNYSPLYVNKMQKALKEFRGGQAIFTFPSTPIKCAGAPQKIMYIFEEHIRKAGIRNKTDITFNSGLGVLFSSKYYADTLWELAKRRNVNINLRTNLIEVNPKKNEAVFQNLDKPEELSTVHYDLLHITPPMSTPSILKNSKNLVDESGYLKLNKETLQHCDFKNIFGIGDCTSLPTSKTAAAVAGQFGTLHRNLSKAMAGQSLSSVYDGYTSCPLVTGYSTCIMAEFDYTTNPKETFPFDQRKERRSMFHMKKDFMPFMYWNGMVKGYWEGPAIFRKILHLGMK